jgi:hypothetical protein
VEFNVERSFTMSLGDEEKFVDVMEVTVGSIEFEDTRVHQSSLSKKSDRSYSSGSSAQVHLNLELEDAGDDDDAKSVKSVTFSPRELSIPGDYTPRSRLSASLGSPSRLSAASPSPRSILKSRDNSKELSQFKKMREREEKFVQIMKRGSVLTKYTSKGHASERHFYVSEDGSELCWRRVKFTTKKLVKKLLFQNIPVKKVILADVKQVVLGPRTPGFVKYDWQTGCPWNCFSLVMHDRCVDIECKSREEFMIWFQGLQYLCPLSPKSLSRAQVNWLRMLLKTSQMATEMSVDVQDVWRMLVKESRMEIAKQTGQASSGSLSDNSPKKEQIMVAQSIIRPASFSMDQLSPKASIHLEVVGSKSKRGNSMDTVSPKDKEQLHMGAGSSNSLEITDVSNEDVSDKADTITEKSS